MNWIGACAMIASAAAGMAQSAHPLPHSVTAVRHWSVAGATRIVIEVSGEFEYRSDRLHDPERVYYDILGARPNFAKKRLLSEDLDDLFVKHIRAAETAPGVTRIVLEIAPQVEVNASVLSSPNRLILELRHGPAAIPTVTPLAAGSASPPASAGPAKLAAVAPAPPAKNSASQPPMNTEPSAAELQAPNKPEPPPIPGVGLRSVGGYAATSASPTPAGAVPKPARPMLIGETGSPSRSSTNPVTAIRSVGASSAAVPNARPMSIGETGSPSRSSAIPVLIPSSGPSAASSVSTPGAVPNVRPMSIGETGSPSRSSAIPLAAIPSAAGSTATSASTTPPGAVPKPARRMSSGETSLTRALGLKLQRIVIDPGHGGHDEGTQGLKGLLEKDLVLDVSLRLGKLIVEKMGAEVIYTRSDDTFIPLEGRTALANEKKADLFLSIHANSSPAPRITGVETYYLNFTDAKDAMQVAARENAGSDESIFELRDLIQKISLHDKASESRDFADRIQSALFAFSLKTFTGEKNRGVKKAPFVVLIGANMPSVLAEIGFVSNAREETLLKRPEYRQKLAEALYRGISKYADSLSHFQVAAN